MEPTTQNVPSGGFAVSTPAAPRDAAEAIPRGPGVPEDDYLDFALDEDLVAAAEAAVAAAIAGDPAAPAPTPSHPIPEIPKVLPPRVPFVALVGMLACVVLLVGAIALAAARPPAPPPVPTAPAPIVRAAPAPGVTPDGRDDARAD